MNKLKILSFIFFIALSSFIGWNIYSYFFDLTPPTIEIVGLQDQNAYKGEVSGTVLLHDDYKIQEVSIYLDNNPLGNSKEKIGKKNYEYPIVLPTKNIPNGMHTLKIEAVDGAYKKNKSVKEVTFTVDNRPLHAAFSKSDTPFKVFQGRTLHLQFQTSKEIKEARAQALSQTYDCFPESTRSKIYECFIPIPCEEQPNEYVISIDIFDDVGNKVVLENKFQIIAYPFKKQNINVKDEKMKKEAEEAKSNEEFEARIIELIENSPRKKLWQGNFIPPTEIKELGSEFGIQRTSQHRGRYLHQGLDILNSPHSIVWASQNGIIVLKDRYEISGNTVIIDHGYGILSMFFHLDEFAKIDVGDEIKKGNPVGKLGMTGYATGYHLHWEMRVNNIPVDPMQWTKVDF